MSAEIATALIAASGAIILAGTTYWFTKKGERDAELREALQLFQQEIKAGNGSPSREKHNQLMSDLFYEIRRDLGVVGDNQATFGVGLWSAGVPPEKSKG